MRILDIDMDFFLDDVANFISDKDTSRIDGNYYKPWSEEDVINFIENNLGLSKANKVKGRIIVNHDEALYFWRDLIHKKILNIPFEVVHVDSHADLGLGYTSWAFIYEKLLGLDVNERDNIENYENIFCNYNIPGIGDYLLYVLAFRWISKLTYVSNLNEVGDDYPIHIMKDFDDNSGIIRLPYNNVHAATVINDGKRKREEYLSSSIFEPEVKFNIITHLEDVKYDGNFDYITFCQSPNYTPESSDFIIDIIKEYIDKV